MGNAVFERYCYGKYCMQAMLTSTFLHTHTIISPSFQSTSFSQTSPSDLHSIEYFFASHTSYRASEAYRTKLPRARVF
jgi:hypothetical protein